MIRPERSVRARFKSNSLSNAYWDMDDIHAKVPVDRVAVRVVGPGEHFDPNKKIQTNDRSTPIPTRPVPFGVEDLTGTRMGRLTVLGLARDFKKHWVVRCDCGTYTTRRRKSILNPGNGADRCEHCRHLAFLKRDDLWRRTGKEVSYDEF